MFNTILAQTGAGDLSTFERLLNYPPAQLLFGVMIVSVLINLYMSWSNNKTINKRAESDDKYNQRLLEFTSQMATVATSIPAALSQTRDLIDDSHIATSEMYRQQGAMLSTMAKSVTDMPTIFQSMQQANAAMLAEVKNVVTAVNEMLGRFTDHLQSVETLQMETRKQFHKELEAAVEAYAEVVTRQIREVVPATQDIPFPPDDDCRWQSYIVRPAIDNVTPKLYKSPNGNDNNILTTLKESGTVAKVIPNAFIPGWHAVILVFNGVETEQPSRGYVPAGAVVLSPLVETAADKELAKKLHDAPELDKKE